MMGKKIYTYILKDKELDIYKIGRTSNPGKRFNELCKKGEIFPIAVVGKDIEQHLHKTFKENRMEINVKASSGATEWFRKGGKLFDEFIEDIDDGKEVPYLSVTYMMTGMDKKGSFTIIGPQAIWDFEQMRFGYHVTGIAFLKVLGALDKYGKVTDNYEKYLGEYAGRILLTERFVDLLSKGYELYLGDSGSLTRLKKMKGENTVALINANISKTNTFYLLINKVL